MLWEREVLHSDRKSEETGSGQRKYQKARINTGKHAIWKRYNLCAGRKNCPDGEDRKVQNDIKNLNV